MISGPRKTANIINGLENCRNAIGIGSSVATMDPTVGMKLRKNAKTPNTIASSSPKNFKINPTRIPVDADVINFVTK